jgi:hypothetical protein
MARIEGEMVIGRPVDVVFDYVADQSNGAAVQPAHGAGGEDHRGGRGEGNQVPLGCGVHGCIRPGRHPHHTELDFVVARSAAV